MWGEAWGVWEKVRGDVRGVKKCGGSVGKCRERYGGCGEVCWMRGEVRRNLGKSKGDVGSVKKCGGGVGERMG